MTTVSAIIVTYNRLNDLKHTLERSLKEPFLEVFVINNASTDGTKEWLESEAEKSNTLKVKHLQNNGGGAGGFYEGMKWAAEKGGADWFCCFDDDAYPQEGSINNFCQKGYESFTAIAAAVYTHDGNINDMNRPGYNPFNWRRFLSTLFKGREGYHLSTDAYQTKELHKIDYSSFVGFFVRASWVKNNNLPKKELFLYADDVFYTLNISQANNTLMFDPNIKFVHANQTLGSQQGKYFPVWKAYYKYRNDVLLYKHVAGSLFIPILILKTISWIIIVRTYKTNKKAYLRVVFFAFKDGVQNNFSRSINEVKNIAEK